MREAVYQVMLKSHIVSAPSEMTARACTEHELYEEVFPHGPGARSQPASEEERLARQHLSRKLWGFVNTGTTGYCNKRAEIDGHTLVMCEAAVGRTYHSEETGRPNPKTEPGRFFTDHADLIAQNSTLPQTLKLTKSADAVARHLTMALRRHPEMAPVIARQTVGALKQTQLTLSPLADAKTAAALAAPARSEDEVA
ncbi:MAG TPA: hypothetical protein VIJ34_07560 [Acidimicrobiales bacterium]